MIKNKDDIIKKRPVKEIDIMYNNNLNALKCRYPQLVKDLEKTVITNYSIRLTGPKNMMNMYIHQQNCFFYDENDPNRDSINQIEILKLRNTRIALFLGIGLGYEFLHFVQNMINAQHTTYIIALEKNIEILKLAFKAFNFVPMIKHEKIEFIIGVKEEDLFVKFAGIFSQKQDMLLLINAMKPIYHMTNMRLEKNYYLSALKKIKDAGVHRLGMFGNAPHDAIWGIENTFRNISEIIYNPGFNLIMDKFKGKPAVVIASGPSLKKNVHLLRGLENKAVLICADSTLRPLIKMGIKPHIVASLERTEPTIRVLENFTPEEVKDVYLAAVPVIPNDAYKAYSGPKIIVYREYNFYRWLSIERGRQKIMQSSGNMAFKLATGLSCNPIIIIGQDLAFSRDDDSTHISGVDYGTKQEMYYKKRRFEVMGNDGKPIMTSVEWYPFLKGYEVNIADYKGNTVINSTEGGAYINGTIVMPFAEAIEKYIKNNIYPLDTIRQSLMQFTDKEAEKDYKKVSSVVKEAIPDLEFIIDVCKEGIALYEKYREELIPYLDYTKEPEKAVQDKFEKIKNELLACKIKSHTPNKTFQDFLMDVVQPIYINFEVELAAAPDLYDSEIAARADYILRHKKWFLSIYELTKICLNILKQAEIFLETGKPFETSIPWVLNNDMFLNIDDTNNKNKPEN
jgi:hypothetical protein